MNEMDFKAALTLENIAWMAVLMALVGYLGTVMIPKNKYRIWYILTVELALLSRYVLVFVMYKGGTEAAGTDGLIYHEIAKNVAEQLKSGVPIWKVEYKYTWYTVLMGVQYAVFGVNRYAASFVNAVISVLSAYFLFKLCIDLKFSFKKSAFISLAYIFMPSMAVWTTDSRKESLTFFIAIVIWYLGLKAVKEREWSRHKLLITMVSVCVLLWVSTLLRIYMLFALGGGLLVYLFFHYLKTKRRIVLIFGVLVMITCILVTFTTVLANMQGYHALPIDRSQGGDEDIQDEFDSIFKIIMSKNIPNAINGFLTKPHLEKVSSISDISGNAIAVTAVKIEQILWYLCLIFAVFGILDALIRWDPYLLGLLTFILAYSMINALISENVGETYYRYRAAIVAPMLLLIDFRPFFNNLRTLTGKRSKTN